MAFQLETELYTEQVKYWPRSGKYIMGDFRSLYN